MHRKLIEAQNWAESVRECHCKVKSWSSGGNSDSNRVKMDHINKLLSFSNVPCNEPSYHQLKVGPLKLRKAFIHFIYSFMFFFPFSFLMLEIKFL